MEMFIYYTLKQKTNSHVTIITHFNSCQHPAIFVHGSAFSFKRVLKFEMINC